MKPKDTIIETCITLSAEIITALATKHQLRESKWFISRLHKSFKENNIDNLSIEIDTHIDECKMRIATLLRPILEPLDFYVSNKFWFSSKDLKQGYVWLYKGKNAFISNYVMFLTPVEDKIGIKNIYTGEIRHLSECAHLLDNVPSVLPNDAITYSFSLRKLKKQNQNGNK